MPDLLKLKADLIRHEGLRLHPYKCSENALTIGVGRNLTDNGITEAEAMMLLDNDIRSIQSDLDHHLHWWRQQPEPVQRVLLNMCFNLGITRMLGFKRALAATERHDYATAADEMLDSKWATQVGRRARELAEMMRYAG